MNIEKSSMKEIVAATKGFRPNQEAKKVKAIKSWYDPITRDIVVTSQSTGSNDETYHQMLRWPAKPNNKGRMYKGHDNPLVRDEQNVKIHCTCKDFQFTFYKGLKKHKQAGGKFEPYKATGDKPKRDTRAVDFCGCCGHLKALWLKEKRK